MKTSLAAMLLSAAVLTTAAYAQSTPPASTTTTTAPQATTTTMPSDQKMALKGSWRASKLMGLNVYNEQNEKLGDINELIVGKDGKINAVVIGVGGFLGMGEHLVAVPYEKLKFVNEAVAYTGANQGAKPAATTTTGAATGTDKPAATTTSSTSKWYPDHAVFNASKDELKNMPEFKYSE